MYDVIVVGASISGAYFASLLNKDFKVLLLEKRKVFDASEEESLYSGKCCGGLLSGTAQKVIKKLNINIPDDVFIKPDVPSMKVIDVKSKITREYGRRYVNINRYKFEKLFWDSLQGNVTFETGACYKSMTKENDGYLIKYLKCGKECNARGKIVVGADGACSKVRKELNYPYEPKKYLALQEWYRTDASIKNYYIVAEKNITDFYTWLVPKEGYILLGAAIEESNNTKEKFELFKKRLVESGIELNDSMKIKREGSIIYRPTRHKDIVLGSGKILLVGEAAGLISPSSAEGISYALRSAHILAELLNDNLETAPEKYLKKAKSLKKEAFLRNIRSPFMYNEFLRGLIMKLNINTVRRSDGDI